ncbi:MAG: SRPBCC family protein [Saprospiraceae bacterium]|jgi:uncharacterized protein YndB with AHSA1/START domain|nr:SRPBCC family protein [Saprospiraceae bacterium]
MKLLVILLLLLLGLVAFVLIAALFIKKSYSVVRSIVIDQPLQTVFDYVKFLKNQDNFSVWATMDPNMKKDFKGTDGTVGFLSSWESDNKKVGVGEQEITSVEPMERIGFQLRFFKPFPGVADASMLTSAVSEHQTQVTWRFDSAMAYPMNVMLLFMNMDQMLGKDLGKGLDNLKAVLEG